MRRKSLFAVVAAFAVISVCIVDFIWKQGAASPVSRSVTMVPEDTAATESSETASEPFPPVTEMALSIRKGSGSLTYAADVDKLTTEQEKLLTGLLDEYYTSLANLKSGDPSRLYAPEAAAELKDEVTLWGVVIGIRSMQKPDLSLTGYHFALTVSSVTERDNGDLSVRVREDFTQNFAAFPGVDSRGMNAVHSFTLMETGDGWRIREHRQIGSQNRVVYGGWRPSSESRTAESMESVLAAARANTKAWETQGTDPGAVAFDHTYDREAAVVYARQWAGERNPDWVSYDRAGGNCQNFTSQALLAGGIPMDTASPGQWKWYGENPSASYQAAGRSPSWSSVSEFLSYVESNEGYGLVAAADAPYYSGEVGDILHLGTGGNWRHTVIITEVIRDEAGQVIDYLVASNTADLLDYPASAYHYTQQMLIKIYGWKGWEAN